MEDTRSEACSAYACSLEDDKALECALAEHWEADSRCVATCPATAESKGAGFVHMHSPDGLLAAEWTR